MKMYPGVIGRAPMSDIKDKKEDIKAESKEEAAYKMIGILCYALQIQNGRDNGCELEIEVDPLTRFCVNSKGELIKKK